MNSFIVGSAFCPGPPNRDPMDSEKRLRVYKSSATMARHVWRVDKAPAKAPMLTRLRCELVNQFTSGILVFFRSLVRDYFQ